jgi:hypothetical protein
MRTLIISLAIVLAAAGSAAASDKTDVMAVLRHNIDAGNKGDMKAALTDCAAQASIVDEFPPHAWQGATACADWAKDFDAYNTQNKITDAIVTLGKPWHVDITGDRAYAVISANYTFKKDGKPVKETGSVWTAALQKVAGVWRITGWAWSKH